MAVALMAVVPASAGAQMVLRSFSDGASTSKAELTDLASQLRADCTRKPVAVKGMTLSTARAHIESQLNRSSSTGARRAFANSKDAKTAASAAAAVFGAVGDGKPWAAIDAALRVQRLDGRDAGPLISLAGLVDAQGMPQEALALLNAATKLKAKASSPMGIDIRAVADNNRGLALLLLGYPKQAISFLTTAERKAPLLTEARINLDASQQCSWVLLPGGSRGQPPVIADPPFWREDQPSDWTTDDQGNPVQVASSIFDLSQGRSWSSLYVALPDSVPQGAAMHDAGYYDSLIHTLDSQSAADSSRATSLEAKVHDPNTQTSHRRLAVWRAYTSANWQPEVRSAWTSYDSQYNAYIAATDIGTGEGNGGSLDASRPMYDALQQCPPEGDLQACETSVCVPETNEVFAKWKPVMAQLSDAAQRYETAFWKYATGLAANLQNPADHQQMLLEAESMMLGANSNIAGLAQGQVDALVASRDTCVAGYGNSPAAGNAPSEEQSPACPKALKKLPSVDVGEIFSFAIHCEEIELEISTKGWIGAFANVTFNPKAGTATVFTGVQAGALGQQAREGAFINVGPNGVQDGGIRINESTSGPSFMSQSHTVNFSVAGTVPFSE